MIPYQFLGKDHYPHVSKMLQEIQPLAEETTRLIRLLLCLQMKGLDLAALDLAAATTKLVS